MKPAGKRQKQQQQQKLTPLNEGKTVRYRPRRVHLDPRRRKRNGAGCRANLRRQSRGENFLDIPLYRMTRSLRSSINYYSGRLEYVCRILTICQERLKV